MNIEWQYLSLNNSDIKKQLLIAENTLANNKSFFFVVKKDIFQEVKLIKNNKNNDDNFLTRYDVLQTVNKLKDDKTIIIATTGKTGRELYEIEDAVNNLYLVGSMGYAGSLGFGLAHAKSDKKIIVIDGDGALLMHMGCLATNGYYDVSNMLHILLDNNSYDSTGGQFTVSNGIDFVSVASSLGYSCSICVDDLEELDYHIQWWKKTNVLTFLYLKIARGSKKSLGRPKIKPHEVKERVVKFINEKLENNLE